MSNLVEKLRGAIVVTSEGKGLRLSLSADDVEAAADRIEALERHVELLQNKIEPDENCACGFDGPEDICVRHSPQVHALTADLAAARSVYLTMQQSAAALAKRLETANEALKPFADYCGELNGFLDNHNQPLPDSDGPGWVYVKIGDFRRARSVLEEQKP